ncbi:MAG: 30S ribosomal protein S24e [Methanosphaera stadtmanae]|jgi:small subunit ribosomal protein S24e|nr:30S ribosomal protein S24e [Methanosphaera stadtmanae]
MDITILEKKENPLLNRTEITFECDYQTEGTPKIIDVKHKLVALEDASKELLVVDSMKPSYGEAKAVGLAKIYNSIEDLNKIETDSVKNKNEEPEEEAPAEEEAPEEEAEAEE